jgi:hypothetical protein
LYFYILSWIVLYTYKPYLNNEMTIMHCKIYINPNGSARINIGSNFDAPLENGEDLLAEWRPEKKELVFKSTKDMKL